MNVSTWWKIFTFLFVFQAPCTVVSCAQKVQRKKLCEYKFVVYQSTNNTAALEDFLTDNRYLRVLDLTNFSTVVYRPLKIVSCRLKQLTMDGVLKNTSVVMHDIAKMLCPNLIWLDLSNCTMSSFLWSRMLDNKRIYRGKNFDGCPALKQLGIRNSNGMLGYVWQKILERGLRCVHCYASNRRCEDDNDCADGNSPCFEHAALLKSCACSKTIHCELCKDWLGNPKKLFECSCSNPGSGCIIL